MSADKTNRIRDPTPGLLRQIGFFGATGLVISKMVVGSGSLSVRLGAGQMVASALIAGFTVLNIFGVGRAAKVQTVLTSTKIVVIAGFVLFGFLAGTGDWRHFSEPAVRTSTFGMP